MQEAENQEDIAKAFEEASEDLGYRVKVIFTDPSNSPQLIGVDENGNTYIKDGTAYVDKDTGIGYILVNTESPANSTKAGVIGTIAEEQSHVIGKKEGRQKVVPDGSEKGLESLGRPANEYVKKKFGEDNNSKIKLTTDGIDLSNADVGEKVGDWGPDDDHQVSSSKNYRTDNGAFKVIAKPKKGETEGEAIIDGRYKIEYTDDFNFSKEGKNPEKLARLKKRAKKLSQIDKDNNYIVTVSRKEGINIIAVPKDKFWIENLVNDVDEGVQTVGKNFKELKKNSKDKKYGKAVLSFGKTVISVPGIFQTGIGTTIAESVYNFKGGEVEYGIKKEILARRKANKDATKGVIDNFVGLAIATSAPNKIGGGNYPKYSLELQPAQSIMAAGDGVTAIAGTGYNLQLVKKLKYLEGVSTGPGKGLMMASAVGSSSKDSEKNNTKVKNDIDNYKGAQNQTSATKTKKDLAREQKANELIQNGKTKEAEKLKEMIWKTDSKKLDDELLKAGVVKPDYKCAAHHIVTDKMDDVVEIFKEYDIDINSTANGVYLPSRGAKLSEVGKEAIHIGATSDEYRGNLTKRIVDLVKELNKTNLSKVAKKNKILEEINDVRNELLTGKLKINNAKLKN